jgi:hypothetical protein
LEVVEKNWLGRKKLKMVDFGGYARMVGKEVEI